MPVPLPSIDIPNAIWGQHNGSLNECHGPINFGLQHIFIASQPVPLAAINAPALTVHAITHHVVDKQQPLVFCDLGPELSRSVLHSTIINDLHCGQSELFSCTIHSEHIVNVHLELLQDLIFLTLISS